MNSGDYPLKNIVLIGMPGAGKSTMGVILAKTLGRNLSILLSWHRKQPESSCEEIIDDKGTAAFLETEEKTILPLYGHNAVIATGGSVVFSEKAMKPLKKDGVVIYPAAPVREWSGDSRNITTRGIVLVAGQSLRDLYNQRIPFYEKYADRTIDCSDGDFEKCIGNVIDGLPAFRG